MTAWDVRVLAGRRLVLAVALGLAPNACNQTASHDAAVMTGGHAERAGALIRRYGCASCHTIPGIAGAHSVVGPSLAGIASRSYIAGVVPNDPETLIRWIVNPKAIDSLTAMPVTGVSTDQARDIAAYLYTLQ